MEYLTTAEAAERWGVTARRVQTLCKNGRIEGAVYKGVWLIPANAICKNIESIRQNEYPSLLLFHIFDTID